MRRPPATPDDPIHLAVFALLDGRGLLMIEPRFAADRLVDGHLDVPDAPGIGRVPHADALRDAQVTRPVG